MFSPPICARVEKANEIARLLRERSNVAALISITEQASISQIIWLGRSSVLQGYDVIDFAAEEGVFFCNQAILAKVICAVATKRRSSAPTRSAIGHMLAGARLCQSHEVFELQIMI